MIKVKLFLFYLFAKSFFCNCHNSLNEQSLPEDQPSIKIHKTGKLEPIVSESSGALAEIKDRKIFLWTMNDGGGLPEIYLADLKGKVIRSIPIPNAKNTDWEDLASDNQGHIFIGDFGNNKNRRKDLLIYKYDTLTKSVSEIHFFYPDQQKFPPSGDRLNFDAEAFFWFDHHLYIFSKNRGIKTEKIYKIPDQAGNHIAKITDTHFLDGMVTSADISPSGKRFVLLTYKAIFLFNIEHNTVSFEFPYTCRRFSRGGQTEAIAFADEQTLVITSENREIFLVDITE